MAQDCAMAQGCAMVQDCAMVSRDGCGFRLVAQMRLTTAHREVYAVIGSLSSHSLRVFFIEAFAKHFTKI
jgi:hypothetical protein